MSKLDGGDDVDGMLSSMQKLYDEPLPNPIESDDIGNKKKIQKDPEMMSMRAVADVLGVDDIGYPRSKIRVLIIGNHSSGKSSFINWYIGENVLPTGVYVMMDDCRMSLCM